MMGAMLAVLAGVVSSQAAASPLLSGYGGPGQGNQAILGATLLNGPSGSDGGGPPGTGVSAGASSGSLAEANTAPQAQGGLPAGSSRGAGGARERSVKAADGTSIRGARAYPSSPRLALGVAAAYRTPTLGISEVDLVFIILATAALAATATFTSRLARQAR
jgi:hypothetical protein